MPVRYFKGCSLLQATVVGKGSLFSEKGWRPSISVESVLGEVCGRRYTFRNAFGLLPKPFEALVLLSEPRALES